MLQSFLQQLGLSPKEQTIYLVLAEIGVQPASVIARRANLDRVTTYKHLKKMAEQGLVKMYARDSVQCFGIESFDVLETFLQERKETFDELLTTFPIAVNMLRALKKEEDIIPRLQMFEGQSGTKALFRDLLFEIKEQHIKAIRILSSNIVTESAEDAGLRKAVDELFIDLKERVVEVELYEATGSAVPERLKRIPFGETERDHFSVSHGSSTIFVVGHAIYLATFKGGHVGLKIKQADLSQIFHFLFDFLGFHSSEIDQ